MTRYVLDAYAWIEYFRGTDSGLKVKRILDDARNSAFTNVVTLAEIASKIAREGLNADDPLSVVMSRSKIFMIDELLSKKAGTLHAMTKKGKKNFSYGDAFVLLSSHVLDATIITGDSDFKGMKNVLFI